MTEEVDKIVVWEFKEQESKFETLNPKLNEKQQGSQELQEKRSELRAEPSDKHCESEKATVTMKPSKEVKVQL